MDAERVYGVPSLDGSLEYHCFIAFSYEDKDVGKLEYIRCFILFC